MNIIINESPKVELVCRAGSTPEESTAALQAAIDMAGTLDEVRPIIKCFGTFELNNSIIRDSECEIHGGTFTRIDESFCTTQEEIEVTAGSFMVVVDEVPSHWRANTRVVVRDPSLPTVNGIGPNSHDNLAHASGGTTTMRIDAINGNMITIGNGSDTAMPIGAEIVQSIDLFVQTARGGFRGSTFDGNRANNNLEDWLCHWNVHTSASADDNEFIRPTFKNNPCENISANVGTKLISLRAWDNNGSVCHISTVEDTDNEGVKIFSPYARDCCEKSQSLGHSEAYVTFSIRTKFVTIRDGHFLNTNRYTGTDVGACDVLGEVSHVDDDSFIVFENMMCKNFENIWYFKPTSGDEHTHQYRLKGSTFVSCGDIWTNTGDVSTPVTEQYTGIEIDDNKFWGSRVHLKSGLKAKITDNEFYLQGYLDLLADSPTGDADADTAVLYLYGDHFTVRGNKLFNHIDDDGYPNQVELASGGTYCNHAIRLDSEGQGDELKIMKNTKVHDNEIYGFAIGIRVGNHASFYPSSNYVKQILINDNLIILTRGNDGSTNRNGTLQLGIVGMPGCSLYTNDIIGLGVISSGILVSGANDTYNDRLTFLLGNKVRATEAPGNSGIRYGVASTLNRGIISRNNFATSFNDQGGHATQDISGDATIPLEPDLDDTWIFQQYPAPF